MPTTNLRTGSVAIRENPGARYNDNPIRTGSRACKRLSTCEDANVVTTDLGNSIRNNGVRYIPRQVPRSMRQCVYVWFLSGFPLLIAKDPISRTDPCSPPVTLCHPARELMLAPLCQAFGLCFVVVGGETWIFCNSLDQRISHSKRPGCVEADEERGDCCDFVEDAEREHQRRQRRSCSR